MGFYKNTRIFIAAASVIAAVLAVFISTRDLLSGIIFTITIFTLIFSFAFLLHSRKISIDSLTLLTDKMLHGDTGLSEEYLTESELSSLYDVIYKMTVVMREQAEKLENDKNFLADSIADISHQIRTPLTSINLILSLLKNQSTPEARKKELINELSMMVSHIDELILSLLKISKLDAGSISFKADPFLLQDLIRKSTDPFLIQIELKNQTLILPETNGEQITGDIDWLSEALGNIIKNCSEHTPGDGLIEISYRDTPLFMEIFISDNGKSIYESDLPHIFERFYKGKNSSPNSHGIGLYLTKSVITAHNGVISVKNLNEGGVVFKIKLYRQKTI